MLTKTSLLALRMLIELGRSEAWRPIPPKELAAGLDESPSYVAKVARQLAKAGLLRTRRGAQGGVQPGLPPEQVSLLAVVRACQGRMAGSRWVDASTATAVDSARSRCAYHQAALELRQAVLGVLSRWTLADFLADHRPGEVEPRCDDCAPSPPGGDDRRPPRRPAARRRRPASPSPRKPEEPR